MSFIWLWHRLCKALHPQLGQSWRIVLGLKSHKTDSRELGHKPDAQFWDLTARTALSFPKGSRLDRLVPPANTLPRRYLDAWPPAAPVLMPGRLGQPGSPQGTIKAGVTISSLLSQTEKESDSASYQMAGQAKKPHCQVGLRKGGGDVMVEEVTEPRVIETANRGTLDPQVNETVPGRMLTHGSSKQRPFWVAAARWLKRPQAVN